MLCFVFRPQRLNQQLLEVYMSGASLVLAIYNILSIYSTLSVKLPQRVYVSLN